MATIDDFAALDIRVGTVKEAEFFGEAKIPAIKLKIDFGPEIGMKSSSAQITKRYKAEEMIGKQIIAIVNFPPRRIAGFQSDVLVLGGVPEKGDVILLKPEIEIPNGTPIG
ncbi:chaperone CsaA [Paenibacillus methanolicus]|uniref:tRNA-binding protein n=1 Tax=Paenibacillus methanolicus TaxID=582686 RepID=A0A5S5BYI3_9BACL|nr:chaperone CsaA [Paenibacillus methanolicus]TYP71999.1 tRNA-binding protein [Paenibacillus methanolicus]